MRIYESDVIDIRDKFDLFIEAYLYHTYEYGYYSEPDGSIIINLAFEYKKSFPNLYYQTIMDDDNAFMVFSKEEVTQKEALSYVFLMRNNFGIEYFEELDRKKEEVRLKEQAVLERKAKEKNAPKTILNSTSSLFQNEIFDKFEGHGVLNETINSIEELKRVVNLYPQLKVFLFSVTFADFDILKMVREMIPDSRIGVVFKTVGDAEKLAFRDYVDFLISMKYIDTWESEKVFQQFSSEG